MSGERQGTPTCLQGHRPLGGRAAPAGGSASTGHAGQAALVPLVHQALPRRALRSAGHEGGVGRRPS